MIYFGIIPEQMNLLDCPNDCLRSIIDYIPSRSIFSLVRSCKKLALLLDEPTKFKLILYEELRCNSRYKTGPFIKHMRRYREFYKSSDEKYFGGLGCMLRIISHNMTVDYRLDGFYFFLIAIFTNGSSDVRSTVKIIPLLVQMNLTKLLVTLTFVEQTILTYPQDKSVTTECTKQFEFLLDYVAYPYYNNHCTSVIICAVKIYRGQWEKLVRFLEKYHLSLEDKTRPVRGERIYMYAVFPLYPKSVIVCDRGFIDFLTSNDTHRIIDPSVVERILYDLRNELTRLN